MASSEGFPGSTGPTTTSFWRSELHELDDLRSSESLPASSDVVIIGAGIAGVATAYHLLEAGFTGSITLLEARGACSGASGRNGGHVRPDLYGHIPVFMERSGVEAGAEIAEFEISHVQAMKKVVEREGIDCDFTLTRTTDVWCNEEAAQRAKSVYDDLVAKGMKYMEDVHFVIGSRAEGISGVKNAKACATYTAATMWPYKFVLHLVGLLHRRGVNIQTHTPVREVVDDGEAAGEEKQKQKHRLVVRTAGDRGSVRAGTVVHATNAHARALLPKYAASIVPCRGVCTHIASPPTGGKGKPFLNNSYVVREEAAPNALSYLIPRAEGGSGGGTGIVVGGASQLFRADRDSWYDVVDDGALMPAAADYFADDYMQRNFVGWEDSGAKVSHVWSGIMGYSWDSHPHIGWVPDRPGQAILAGFNGHGMPVAWLAARGLAALLLKPDSSGRTGTSFADATGLPRLYETTRARLDRARAGPEGGDIMPGVRDLDTTDSTKATGKKPAEVSIAEVPTGVDVDVASG